uniref:NADH-ubiquinone oxidoreductase chain 4L n=1 Tax=Squilloides leptosquilla TaxID=1653081 RepID=A0A0F7J1B5_9CRUS|nr:NADH dehydrogenase subunit 4L [Squilloides leptosquilla]AKH03060.1 NADH dehydrogenase subunit 4L [Squilloides leptosquilla]
MLSLNFYLFGSIVMILSGMWGFVSKRKHLLSSLLSLEYMMLGIFWFLTMIFSYMGQESYFTLVFLTFAACEGALALSILVSIIRTHGNDRFSSFTSLRC